MTLAVPDLAEAAAEASLTRAGWQHVVFAARPQRHQLRSLIPAWSRDPVRVHVVRNQPFELVLSAMVPFLQFAGWEPEVTYSQYDDSLQFSDLPANDLVLVWLDHRRYTSADGAGRADWLAERLASLRALTDSPIIVTDNPYSDGAAFNRRLAESIRVQPGLHLWPQSAVAHDLGPDYLDPRLLSVAGSDLSDAGSVETARRLGLVALPALLNAAVKAIAVDADGTLYSGVLAEDGTAGLEVTRDHHRLHRRLLELRQHGIFLAAVSRNESKDFEDLLASGRLELGASDFSAMAVDWNGKAAGIDRVARDLRIAPDSILFLDDNAGELAAVAAAYPGLRTVHASDAAGTIAALEYFPGLFRFAQTRESSLRVADLEAVRRRTEQSAEAPDPRAYLRSLEVRLEFWMNHEPHAARLVDLSARTNQFNTALSRISEVDVRRYLTDPGRAVVTAALQDRLSDSGVIAALFASRRGETLVVDEVAISCRALGRNIETLLITEGVRALSEKLGTSSVHFVFSRGDRNQPALAWLATAAAPVQGESGTVELLGDGGWRTLASDLGVTVGWHDGD